MLYCFGCRISIARLGRVRVWIDLICTVSVALDASKPYCFSLRPVNILCGSSIVNDLFDLGL